MVKSKIVMGVDPQDLVNQINAMLNGGTGFVGDTESVDAGHTHIPEKYACGVQLQDTANAKTLLFTSPFKSGLYAQINAHIESAIAAQLGGIIEVSGNWFGWATAYSIPENTLSTVIAPAVEEVLVETLITPPAEEIEEDKTPEEEVEKTEDEEVVKTPEVGIPTLDTTDKASKKK